MNKQLIFGIAVLVTGLTLLVAKVIEIEDITNNWYTIGIALSGLYAWWKVDETKKENQKLKNDIQQLKMGTGTGNFAGDTAVDSVELRREKNHGYKNDS